MPETGAGTSNQGTPLTIPRQGRERFRPGALTRFLGSRKRSERWARIARESSQQSRRVRIPEVLPAVRLERCLTETAAHRYFLDESLAPPLLREIPSGRSGTAALLVG